MTDENQFTTPAQAAPDTRKEPDMNTETHTELRADLDKMKKATQAVYLACEASVADDISAMLKAAIDEIERLRNQLAALPDDNRASEDGWRPIETAPRDGTRVLIADEGVWMAVARFWPCNMHWTEDEVSGMKLNDPTHWRPLPAPPTPSREPRPAGGGEDQPKESSNV